MNNKIEIGDTVVPHIDSSYVDLIKMGLSALFGNNDKNINYALETTMDKECKVIDIIKDKDTTSYIVERNNVRFPYSKYALLLKEKSVINKTSIDKTNKENDKPLLCLDIYQDRININYKDNNKYQDISIEKFKDEPIKSLLDRTFSLIYNLFDKNNIEQSNFSLKNGIKYYRFSDFKDLESIEKVIYYSTNIISSIDKKIGNYAESKEQLMNKKEEILNNLKEVGV